VPRLFELPSRSEVLPIKPDLIVPSNPIKLRRQIPISELKHPRGIVPAAVAVARPDAVERSAPQIFAQQSRPIIPSFLVDNRNSRGEFIGSRDVGVAAESLGPNITPKTVTSPPEQRDIMARALPVSLASIKVPSAIPDNAYQVEPKARANDLPAQQVRVEAVAPPQQSDARITPLRNDLASLLFNNLSAQRSSSFPKEAIYIFGAMAFIILLRR